MRLVARGHCGFANAVIALVIGATLLHDGVGDTKRQLAEELDCDPTPVDRSDDRTGRGLNGVHIRRKLSRGNSCSRGRVLHLCGDDSRAAHTLPADDESTPALGATRRVCREMSLTVPRPASSGLTPR